jgi:LmbE family N-acetylglucosaminyl deacetylase
MAALPFASVDEIIGGGTALVLAPHADDESLGCGGLIAEACASGRPPLVVVLTDGALSHPDSRSHPPSRLRAVRRAEVQTAVAILGLGSERLHFLEIPDGRAPHAGPGMEAAAASVADLARAHKAGTIFATWEHDPHPDHVAAQAIAREAARLVGARVVSYPVWGWTLPRGTPLPVGSITGARLDIAQHLAAKRRAIAAHKSQHSGLILDDPRGFRLPKSLLSAMDRPFEVFLFKR